MSQHATWQTYPWTEYLTNNQEAQRNLRMPGEPWTPMYPDNPDTRTAASWDAYENAVAELWGKWLYFTHMEGIHFVMRLGRDLRRQLGLEIV